MQLEVVKSPPKLPVVGDDGHAARRRRPPPPLTSAPTSLRPTIIYRTTNTHWRADDRTGNKKFAHPSRRRLLYHMTVPPHATASLRRRHQHPVRHFSTAQSTITLSNLCLSPLLSGEHPSLLVPLSTSGKAPKSKRPAMSEKQLDYFGNLGIGFGDRIWGFTLGNSQASPIGQTNYQSNSSGVAQRMQPVATQQLFEEEISGTDGGEPMSRLCVFSPKGQREGQGRKVDLSQEKDALIVHKILEQHKKGQGMEMEEQR
ncbi:type IV secretory system Conjugative DNAtransfer [Striga asiatica]|uniref:Type IV secretory system Conjugative DNAtransfer n=1 Tax=Striga asiatica TaxID=4170 RepID=A0A5A7PD81_STRAF|nr:type IV secretory system Conjugative DNAtransfer [Striga asiatica]